MQGFAYLRTLAYADFGAASAGEVVYVARKIARDGGGCDAFVQAWNQQGRLAARMADDALAAGRSLAARAPRPTVVISGGGDGHGEELYFLAGVPHALARGLNVVLFHGPGQRGLLHHHPGQVFRADSEVPFGAVLVYVTTRSDVRADSVALYGLSFGGYLAPRAAAHDRRGAALVANAPILDFHSLIFDALISALPTPPPADAPAEFWNGLYQRVGRVDWALHATMDTYMLWTTGAETCADFHRLSRSFTLDGLVPRIACPTLTLSSDGENALARRQAREFHEQLRVPTRAFHRLAIEEGADSHCGLSDIALTSSLAYDWLAGVLTGRS